MSVLVDLTHSEFLNRKWRATIPVPGGQQYRHRLERNHYLGTAAMAANLTIGKKGYEEHEELMQHIAGVVFARAKIPLSRILTAIPKPTTVCLPASRMPKATDEEEPPAALPFRKLPSLPRLCPCRWPAMPTN